MLGKEMKGEVKKRMKEDPTGLQAAYFCSKSAVDITKKVNENLPDGIAVYRTALKYRNPDNAPDATDTEVMNDMISQMKSGSFDKRPRLVSVGEKRRVYMPLIVGKACLKCHGDISKMDPKVVELMKKRYPEDRATGFAEGDLRRVMVSEISK